MTRGRQRLKASPLSPCSGPMLEGFGDFLRPPTRRTDVERSPVPRAADTSACCFPLADGACHDTQNSHTVTHQTAEATQVWGSNLLCFSAAKRVCKLNWTRVKNNHRPPCLALSPLYRNAEDLSRGNAFSFFTVISPLGAMAIGTQAAFWACSFSRSHVEVTADVRPLPPSSLELEGLCYSEKDGFSLLMG